MTTQSDFTFEGICFDTETVLLDYDTTLLSSAEAVSGTMTESQMYEMAGYYITKFVIYCAIIGGIIAAIVHSVKGSGKSKKAEKKANTTTVFANGIYARKPDTIKNKEDKSDK